ncbi:MAG: hypothetical protein NZ903_00350, partial [Candidatus Micrarchaeota archaeon]|nr:hypothetical protein [Candidatus Micrarchaeota archaeon]
SKAQLLSINVNNISLIDESIDSLLKSKEMLYQRAESMYSDLPLIRGKVYSILNSLQTYASNIVFKYKQRIDSLDRTYFIENRFLPEKTLGNYKMLLSSYSSVLNELNEQASSLLSIYLANNYKARTVYESLPEVDSFVNMTTYVELRNDLQLSSNSQVVVKLYGIPFALNTVVESDVAGVYAIKEKDYVSIYLPSVREKTNYVLRLKSYTKPATLVSREAKRISLTNEKLIEEIVYTIESNYNLDYLQLRDEYYADGCSVQMNNRVQTVRTLSNLTILLSNVQTGRQKITATCSLNNPITYSTSEYKSLDNKISYIFKLKSNYADLTNVTYVLEIMGAADHIDSTSVRVYDSKGQVPERFEFYRKGDKYYAKWHIPLLTTEYMEYTVSYITTDIVSNYKTTKLGIENISASEGIDVSNYLTDAEYKATRGRYDEAMNSLDRAMKEINKVRSERSENASLSERLNKISQHISQLKNRSNDMYLYALNLSIPDVNVELSKQIAEFESNEKIAKSYLMKGDLSNAKSVISQLERMVSSNKIDNAIYSKEKKLYDRLSSIEKKIMGLGKVTDVSMFVEKLNEVKSHFSGVAPSVANQDYFTALSNLHNVTYLLDQLESNFENISIKMNADLDVKLKNSKETIDLWKKKKQSFLSALSIEKDSPVQTLPSSVQEIFRKINETDVKVAELNNLYSTLKDAKLNERIERLDRFEDLNKMTEKIISDMDYYTKTIEQYKKTSAEILRDVGQTFELKLTTGSDAEKRRAMELQPIFASAKESYNQGKYLNSILMAQYLRDQLAKAPKAQETFDLSLIIYVIIVALGGLIIFNVLSRKEPPKSERRIEKLKLD